MNMVMVRIRIRFRCIPGDLHHQCHFLD